MKTNPSPQNHLPQQDTLVKYADPLGHCVLVSPTLLPPCGRPWHELAQVITMPTFVIEKKKKALYFMRMLTLDMNLLVMARAAGKCFIVEDCQENPSAEYVASLLEKATLTSFP